MSIIPGPQLGTVQFSDKNKQVCTDGSVAQMQPGFFVSFKQTRLRGEKTPLSKNTKDLSRAPSTTFPTPGRSTGRKSGQRGTRQQSTTTKKRSRHPSPTPRVPFPALSVGLCANHGPAPMASETGLPAHVLVSRVPEHLPRSYWADRAALGSKGEQVLLPAGVQRRGSVLETSPRGPPCDELGNALCGCGCGCAGMYARGAPPLPRFLHAHLAAVQCACCFRRQSPATLTGRAAASFFALPTDCVPQPVYPELLAPLCPDIILAEGSRLGVTLHRLCWMLDRAPKRVQARLHRCSFLPAFV